MARDKKEPALQQQYFSVRDTAAILGVSESFIYSFTCRKTKKEPPIPFRRIGGKLLFHRAALGI